MSPLLPEYNVKHCRQIDAYPLVNRTMSPGTNSLPGSSQTDTFMHAVGSATLNVRTSRFSLVTVAAPTSRTINTTLIFFRPGRMSFIVISLYIVFLKIEKQKMGQSLGQSPLMVES